MKTPRLITQKGGTGKTARSIHVAVRASLDGLHILLFDAFPRPAPALDGSGAAG